MNSNTPHSRSQKVPHVLQCNAQRAYTRAYTDTAASLLDSADGVDGMHGGCPASRHTHIHHLPIYAHLSYILYLAIRALPMYLCLEQ